MCTSSCEDTYLYFGGGNATLHFIIVRGCNKIFKTTTFYSICLEKPDANILIFQITKSPFHRLVRSSIN